MISKRTIYVLLNDVFYSFGKLFLFKFFLDPVIVNFFLWLEILLSLINKYLKKVVLSDIKPDLIIHYHVVCYQIELINRLLKRNFSILADKHQRSWIVFDI